MSCLEVPFTLTEGRATKLPSFSGDNGVGGKASVNSAFGRNRRLFGPKRKDGARKMRCADWGAHLGKESERLGRPDSRCL